MWKPILIYAGLLAAGAFALEWLQYQYVARMFATEIYVGILALGFTALGVWAGYRLTPKRAAAGFERNTAALKSLGVTDREFAVLELLAAGQANKEIARNLDVSPNTVNSVRLVDWKVPSHSCPSFRPVFRKSSVFQPFRACQALLTCRIASRISWAATTAFQVWLEPASGKK